MDVPRPRSLDEAEAARNLPESRTSTRNPPLSLCQHVNSTSPELGVAVGVLDRVRTRLADRKKDRVLQRFCDPSFIEPPSHRSAKSTELFPVRREPTMKPWRGRRGEPHCQYRDVIITRLVDTELGDERGTDILGGKISHRPSRIGKPAQANLERFLSALDEPIRIEQEQGAWFEQRRALGAIRIARTAEWRRLRPIEPRNLTRR